MGESGTSFIIGANCPNEKCRLFPNVSQLAFPDDASVRLIETSYAILKITVAHRQFFHNDISASRQVLITGGVRKHNLANPKLAMKVSPSFQHTEIVQHNLSANNQTHRLQPINIYKPTILCIRHVSFTPPFGSPYGCRSACVAPLPKVRATHEIGSGCSGRLGASGAEKLHLQTLWRGGRLRENILALIERKLVCLIS